MQPATPQNGPIRFVFGPLHNRIMDVLWLPALRWFVESDPGEASEDVTYDLIVLRSAFSTIFYEYHLRHSDWIEAARSGGSGLCVWPSNDIRPVILSSAPPMPPPDIQRRP